MELKKNIQLLNNIAAAGLEKLDPDRYETGTDHVDSKEEIPQIDPREDEP